MIPWNLRPLPPFPTPSLRNRPGRPAQPNIPENKKRRNAAILIQRIVRKRQNQGFAPFTNNNRIIQKASGGPRGEKINYWPFKLSKPAVVNQITFFIVNVDLANILEMPIPEGVTELRALRGDNTTAGISTRSHGFVGTLQSVKKLLFKKGQMTVVIEHKKVTISGAGDPEPVVALLKKRYIPGIHANDGKVQTLMGSFYINRTIDLFKFWGAFDNNVPRSLWTKTFYNEELQPISMQIHWKSPKCFIRIIHPGTILVQGLRSRKELAQIHSIFAQFFTKYHVPLSVFRGPERNRVKKSVKKRKVVGKENPQSRAPRWNASPPPGYYVRPGYNGKAYFYELKGEPRLVREKVRKAFNRIKLNIPPKTLEILEFGGENNKTPRKPMIAHKASEWNAKKNGFYIAPGPGHLPHFYKVPKGITGKATAIKRYKEAGVKMPAHVRAIFGIANSPGASPEYVVPTHTFNRAPNGRLRINGKLFKAFSKAQLHRVALNVGAGNVKATNGKIKLVAAIEKHSKVKSSSPVNLAFAKEIENAARAGNKVSSSSSNSMSSFARELENAARVGSRRQSRRASPNFVNANF